MTRDGRRPGPDGPGPQQNTHDDGGGETGSSSVIVADHRGIGAHRHREFCPCGHDPRRDETCVRHRPLGAEVDYLDAPIWWDGRLTSVRHAGTEAVV